MNFKKKLTWAGNNLKTSDLSADNFKKILDLDGSTPETAIRSGDTGQRIPCFDSCQLITTLMCNVCNISLPVLSNWLESVRLNIGCPMVRTDGRAAGGVRSRDYQISGMGRFTYPWCSAGALRAPELRWKKLLLRIGLEYKHDRRSIVLEHQYGRRDVIENALIFFIIIISYLRDANTYEVVLPFSWGKLLPQWSPALTSVLNITLNWWVLMLLFNYFKCNLDKY